MFKILDVIFPTFCLGCGREGLYICKDCEIFLTEIESNSFSILGLWEHEGLIEKAFCRIKKSGQYHIIGELIEKALKKIEFDLPADIVISYVPMPKKKQKERGFNQAELIAWKLADSLYPKKKPVALLDSDSKGNFNYVGNFVPDKVLLVDDFSVTGSTLKNCSKVLQNQGVKKVWSFVLSKKT